MNCLSSGFGHPRRSCDGDELTISRAQDSLTFPANFHLVTGQRSCPCGINHKELLIVKVWGLEEWGEGELL